MKKNLLIITVIFIIIMAILFAKFFSIRKQNLDIKSFNSQYEFYNREDLSGLDITTVINKAINNNERNFVEKDKDGYYIEDENSIKIEIKMIINGKTYPMERIKQIGMESFTEFFGEVSFKCIGIEYHEDSKKVSKMIFESTEY